MAGPVECEYMGKKPIISIVWKWEKTEFPGNRKVNILARIFYVNNEKSSSYFLSGRLFKKKKQQKSNHLRFDREENCPFSTLQEH